ncbi:MAG TPA: BMP family protein [Thermomicrobiales bacterium]|nr:BMP family protein [Thermomicrobiales bacterium]
MMRRRASLILLILVGLVGPWPLGLAPAAQTEVDRAAIVTPGSRSNEGWDQQGVDALVAIGEERGIEVDVVENAGYDDITPILRDLAADGADLIICHASGYQTVCPEFAEREGVPVVVTENPEAVTEGLVSDVETEAQEVAYLAGVMAALETSTGTVAVVASGEPPTWNYMTAGFAAGAKDTDPSVEVLYSVIGEAAYDDAPNARRTTETVIAAGADVIFGMGDGASFGMIQAIREHNAAVSQDEEVRFIDVIGDKSDSDVADFLLTSVLFDYTGAYNTFIDNLESGDFGSIYTMDLENEGVWLLEPPIEVSEETIEQVEAAEQAILEGEIDVPAIAEADELADFLEDLPEGDA